MIETSRLYHNQIQTPILEYRHSKTESRIGMVGLMHFGIPSYFAEAGEYIARRQSERAHIFAEGSRRASQIEIDAAHPDVRQRLVRFSNADRLGKASLDRLLNRGLGMVFQTHPEGLTFHEDWHHHDYSHTEIAERLTAEDMRGDSLVAQVFNIGTRLIPPFLARPAARALVKSLFLGGDNDPSQRSDRVLLHERNELVMRAIDRQCAHDPDSDFVLVWGAGHVSTMNAQLIDRGYESTNEPDKMQWLTVVDLSRSAKDQP